MTAATFKFKSDSVSGGQFTVVGFNGHEAISTLYRFEIEIKAPLSAGIDLDDVLDARASFSIEQNGIESPVHGVLASFEEIKFVQNYCYYKAVLVPEIWKLTNYKTNEIYYQTGSGVLGDSGQTIVDIIHQVFEHAGMASSEYDISSLQGKLLKREYVCQFNESDFDFVSRLLENEGVFYYFEQGAISEKIIFVNNLNYLTIPRPKLVFDVSAQVKNQDDCVYGLSCRKQRLPKKVIVRDYNTDEPSLDVSEVTSIDTMGHGTEYIYGKNVHSDTEAAYLSQIRAEEFICRKTQYFGESSVPRLMSGYIFIIEGHPNPIYNSVEYLAFEVTHEGESLDMSLSGGHSDSKPQYRNSFAAVPAEIQYRPARKTLKPKISGTLHARIDGELDSEYAQLDGEGRYKVSLPFDFHNENHPVGLASARVRMMQPYAGKNRGMQFPMAKGTEVLLSFVDGDPDRPIIAGAINTVVAPGPVTANNQTESVIQTGGRNKIRMEDKFGSERVMLESPAANSWIRVGATNDPVTLQGASPHYVALNTSFVDPQARAESTDAVTGEVVLTSPFSATSISDILGNPATINTAVEGTYVLTYEHAGDTTDTAQRTVIVHDPDGNDLAGTVADGIRLQSIGSLWAESKSQYGSYYGSKPTAVQRPPESATPPQLGDLLSHFGNGYNPKGLISRHSKAYQGSSGTTAGGTNDDSFVQATLSANVQVSSLDTFTTQEGNIYDFGGYWNYNLGNSYAEDHLDQSAVLNATHDFDLLNAGGPGFTGWRAISDSDPSKRIAKDGVVTAHSDNINWTNIWVEKKFGDTYEYTEGSTISVTKGGSQSVQIGGIHVEESYRGTGFTRSSWSKSGDGRSEEKKYSKDGAVLSHSITNNNGYAGISGMDFSFSAKASHEYNFGASTKFSISANATSSLALSASADVDISIGASLSTKIELEAAGSLHLKGSIGPSIFISNGQVDISLPTYEAHFKAPVVNEVSLSELKARINIVDNSASKIENGAMSMSSRLLTLFN